ncbi:galanin receptor type 1-like [Saccostrea echinata]|uniref:galanin receptor type 1-like n=1 Tax=Saccostrea echinata TaxID=191078 RepID=UPI002A80C065|nr:galanin receptor type 1-like [Saccostrea echinata]
MTISRENMTSEATAQDIGGIFSIFVETATIFVNILPLVVVIRGKTYRTRSTTEDIILVLSLLYIFSALIPTPIAHVSYFKNTWIGGEITCKLYQFLMHTLRTSTLCTVAILSLNQTIYIFHFLNMKEYTYLLSAKTKVICIILLNIIGCMVIAFMPLVGLGPVTYQSERCEFWLIQKLENVNEYAFLILFLCFATCNILLILMSSLISLCCKNLIKRKMCISTSVNEEGGYQWQTVGTRVLTGSNLVLAVSIPVIITWVPTMLLVLMREVGVNVSDVSILYALLSTSVSGLVNPIIYGLCDVNFRRRYRRLFMALCNIKQMAPITDQVVTRTASGVETLTPDRRSRGHVQSSSSTGFLNSAFESQTTSEFTSYQPSEEAVETILKEESSLPSEGTQLLAGKNVRNSVKSRKGEKSCIIPEESSSAEFSEELDLYEELSSGRSSEEEDSLNGVNETFI